MKKNIIFWTSAILFLIICMALFFLKNGAENKVYSGVAVTDGSYVTQATEEILLVNINTADKDELMLLTGVGETVAENIIAHRIANGDFLSIEEIMEVSGIGEKKFEAIKDNITVGDGVNQYGAS